MSRPSIRRALRRAGLAPAPKPLRPAGPRNRGTPNPPKIFLPEEDPAEPGDAPVDFERAFGRAAPIELEIGTGKGRFLLDAAASRPERSFLGLELQAEYARIVMSKAARLGLTNIRVEALDGGAFVARRLAPGSLAALHVFFPDPWPKARHHKRRLVCPDFARAAARALSPGAPLRVASDHAGYWAVIEEVLDGSPHLTRDAPSDWLTGTDYELKALAAGKPVGRGIWRPRALSPTP